ncbi:PQ-loop domain-containing transporter [Carboxylicivirga sp. N1Y90]|uniref:PQ-loop domain-containing transporter n=1 Tax=Carboxylicivirga fragile TaxID=3417571 RepID=UPI003D3573BB|nr:hypothetical protein [Marinilabiliaceae bacterium N1Y90]
MIVSLIGTIAAVLTTTAMFPQAIRIIRARDVNSIFLLMYIAQTMGIYYYKSVLKR